ncbi:hypothetical protein ELY14_09850, partial [Legionella septentrionalis]
MSRFVIDDKMWNKLEKLLPSPKGRHGENDRLFIEAVCWIGQEHQALGRCRGGFSSKIHAKVDSFGLPLGFILTGGQEHE